MSAPAFAILRFILGLLGKVLEDKYVKIWNWPDCTLPCRNSRSITLWSDGHCGRNRFLVLRTFRLLAPYKFSSSPYDRVRWPIPSPGCRRSTQRGSCPRRSQSKPQGPSSVLLVPSPCSWNEDEDEGIVWYLTLWWHKSRSVWCHRRRWFRIRRKPLLQSYKLLSWSACNSVLEHPPPQKCQPVSHNTCWLDLSCPTHPIIRGVEGESLGDVRPSSCKLLGQLLHSIWVLDQGCSEDSKKPG